MISRLMLLLLALATSLGAQTTPPFGIRTKTPDLKAYSNARIVVSPTQTIPSGTLVVRDGRIVDVGAHVQIPAGAVIVDLKGKTIYPGFVDPYTQYGLPEVERQMRQSDRRPQYEAVRTGADSWNDANHADKIWVNQFTPDAAKAAELLRLGITAVQSAKFDGIFRGRSYVTLLDTGLTNELILKPQSMHFASFNKGSSEQQYPTSLMGSIALIRQSFLDADWYRKAHAAYRLNPNQRMPEVNLPIAALGQIGNESIMFETDDELSLLRAAKLSTELRVPFVHVGSGHEYEVAKEIAATGQTVILTVNYPRAPEVKTAEDELDVNLADLRYWEQAPSNATMLEQEKVRFAFTTYRLKETRDYLKNIRQAIRRGLSEQTALAALTTVPAQICGLASEIGTLERGKLANFIVCDTNIFVEHARVFATAVKGRIREFVPVEQVDFRGEYSLHLAGKDLFLSLKGAIDTIKGELKLADKKTDLESVVATRDELTFSAKLDSFGIPGITRFSVHRDADQLVGMASLPDLQRHALVATRTGPFVPTPDTSAHERAEAVMVSKVTFPNKGYGVTELPPVANVLIKNATVWTSESEGILSETDVLVQNGKIAKVGKGLTATGATVIDGTDKHVTAGVIDEHSHIAISGDVNEGTMVTTPETRIGDVLNPDDINIYRAMTAGVTTLQLLHGSANPIGAQAQIVKPRWGASAEGLKFANTTPSVKMALGENVKQSNWGAQYTVRYPQSRMGVETILKDVFQAAREYESDWKAYNALGAKEKERTIPPRRDLNLEATLEIVSDRTRIHCHSYVYTEILMLMRLAEEFGFTVQTFTHVTEGYKVADELKAHGASASSIVDWWAYKFEVYDAIPGNMCIMNNRGVVTSINSDSPELGRRLAHEAAKSVMYCGMSPEDAIKMVTINPAIQLKIDDRVGSIKAGKDGDLVIWNGDPLSIYSKPEMTFIDGRIYFDINTDLKARVAIQVEKAALVQKALSSGVRESRRRWREGYKPLDREWECEDIFDYWKEQNEYHATH
ncbi:MAG: amidohydrolase family protein [candidate division Zixibacteria bacterium]|nr:amidohydrolase family protein [candidate division Zixibacteria bacterium]